MKYAYSTDEESYAGPYETADDALAAGLDEIDCCDGETATIWIGEVSQEADPASAYFPHTAALLIDAMDDEAGDKGAMMSSNGHFSRANKEATEALNRKIAACIDQWATEYGLQPRWFDVDRVREVTFDVGSDDETTWSLALSAWLMVKP